MIQATAALLVWIGGSLVVVSDGRRGLAAGITLTTAGMALLAAITVGSVAAAALALGGALAAIGRFAVGPAGWGILPPGSTPRLVLCIAAALVVFWMAAGVTVGSGASLRFAVMVTIGLAAARVLASTEQSGLLTATSLLALSIASAAAIGESETTLWPYLAGALVAIVTGWFPLRSHRAA